MTILAEHAYAVHLQIDLVNRGPGQPEKQNIWVALIRDFPPYQRAHITSITPADYTQVTDEYGNSYAEFDFANQPAGTTRTVSIDFQVTVNELQYDLSVCQGKLGTFFTQPELHIESANPQISALSRQLCEGKSSICDQVRAFYDTIGDHLVYTFNGSNWGAQSALGHMGADPAPWITAQSRKASARTS